jgi:hypothetical protein
MIIVTDCHYDRGSLGSEFRRSRRGPSRPGQPRRWGHAHLQLILPRINNAAKDNECYEVCTTSLSGPHSLKSGKLFGCSQCLSSKAGRSNTDQAACMQCLPMRPTLDLVMVLSLVMSSKGESTVNVCDVTSLIFGAYILSLLLYFAINLCPEDRSRLASVLQASEAAGCHLTDL